jgi:homoserine dehydrogenase
MASAVRVGLVGLGTIGTGVVRLFQEHGADIDRRLGFPLVLAAIADIDLESERGVALAGYTLHRDYKALIDDPGIDIVVELVGGTGVAAQIVRSALCAGKAVATANKALLAHKGDEIWPLAREHGTEIAFEASVCGTIPVLRALREGLAADRIQALHGIVNGTCNYILSEMEEQGEPYASALKRAQDLGYAEVDPRFDVEGTDSAHKLAILLGLAFGLRAGPGDFPVEGIERIAISDIDAAQRLGFRIKLLASARRGAEGVLACVRPCLVPRTGALAAVGGALNALVVDGAFSGRTSYSGAGAGSLPTASAVVADLMELARSRRLGAAGRVAPLGTPELAEGGLCAAAAEEGEYYVRIEASPGSGADAAAELIERLAARGVRVETLARAGRDVVVTTAPVKRAAIAAALDRRSAAGVQILRIERGL